MRGIPPVHRILKPLLYALLATLALVLAPQAALAGPQFLAPLDRYAPQHDQALEGELTALAGKYRRANIANCDEAYGPLSGTDMRSLLFYRQATFERFRWTRSSVGGSYTWYINEGSDQSYLCGEGKVFCQDLHVCLSGPARLVRNSDRLVALGERIQEVDIGKGVKFRFKGCDQSISKFRWVEVLLNNPAHVRTMANGAFAANVVASAIHFADRLCHDDGYSYGYPNVRMDRRDKSGFYDPFANIVVSVVDGTRGYDPRMRPLLRMRTSLSNRPGQVWINESEGWPGVASRSYFALADISAFTAPSSAALPPSTAGDPQANLLARIQALAIRPSPKAMTLEMVKAYGGAGNFGVIVEHVKYAVLANAAYDDNPAIEGWSNISASFGKLTENPATGFRAFVFRADRETVIAVRGSGAPFGEAGNRVNWEDWIATNARFGKAQKPDAERLFQAVRVSCACNPVMTGHSLGGGLTQFIAVKHGTRGIAFDPAPFAEFPAGTQASFKNVISFRNKADPVSIIAPEKIAGTMITVENTPVAKGDNTIEKAALLQTNHSMLYLLQAMRFLEIPNSVLKDNKLIPER